MTSYFPDPLFQHSNFAFDYLPFGHENLEFVIREGVLGVFCLDDAVDVIFASLDLLSKDLYLLLLKLKQDDN